MENLNPAVRHPRVVMLGPPGSGKGTHARALAQQFSIPHLGIGAMFRREVEAESSLGRQIAGTVAAGDLVDDDLVADVVRAALAAPEASQGWVLDGAPRNVDQARLLTPILEGSQPASVLAVALDVPEHELRERLEGRRTREGRADDSPDRVTHRLTVWEATGSQLVAWYGARGTLERVDGLGPVDTVSARVTAVVEHYFDRDRLKRNGPGSREG